MTWGLVVKILVLIFGLVVALALAYLAIFRYLLTRILKP